MPERIVGHGPASFLSAMLLLAALVSVIVLYFTLGPPPCQDDGWFYELTRLAIPLALFVGSVWMYRLRHRSSLIGLLGAVAVPTIAIALNAVAAKADAHRQAECSKRELTQAMAFCGARATHYRIGQDPNGYTAVTLVAPGTTDEVWNCLWNWNTHNGSVSLKVDESAYEHYRRTHGR
jgi:hypothetical protein